MSEILLYPQWKNTISLGIKNTWGWKTFRSNVSPSLKWLSVKNDILDPEWICQNAIKIDQMLHQMTHNRYSVEGSKDMEDTTTKDIPYFEIAVKSLIENMFR